jgi:DNA-binding beta-propeller fold protein YncE
VADQGNYAIRQIDPATAVVTTVAGDGTQVERDGLGRQAAFAAPGGCAYDPASGDLVVTDQLGNAVRRIH